MSDSPAHTVISGPQLNQRFVKVDWRGQVFQDIEFYACHFEDSILREATFWDCSFENCHFEGCDLSNANIEGSSFSQVTFAHSKAVGVQWQKTAIAFQVRYAHCVLNYGSFFKKNLKQIKLLHCQLKEVDFAECNLSRADFSGSDLENSRFLHTDLREANFAEAYHYSLDLQQNKVKNAVFALPEAVSLLKGFGIKVKL